MIRVRVGDFRLGEKERKALLDVIDSGRISEGKKTSDFEKAWTGYIGTRFSVAVNSGTSALMAGLTALKYKYNLKPGTKVVTTPLTFIATINAIYATGFVPVFADVDSHTMVITPQSVKEALKCEPGARILLPVHLMGYPVDMDSINDIAKANNLIVMEDAAQAHGTIYKGKKVGGLSELGIYSFYIAHNVQAGEMGAVVTNDAQIFKLVKKIKAHGRMCECEVCTRPSGVCRILDSYKGDADFDPRFCHDIIGFNFKVMEFQAALGLTQLEKADDIFKKRNQNVKYLNSGLSGLSDILQLPYYSPEVSYLAYPVVLKDGSVISRKKLRAELEASGVETRPLFGCVPTQQKAYEFMKAEYIKKIPNAQYIGTNGFYVGCH